MWAKEVYFSLFIKESAKYDNFEILFFQGTSMQKLGLSQTLSQKLSPQQIQFIKLLQVPTAELEARIEEELETNPALEEGREESDEEEQQEEDFSDDSIEREDELSVEDYLKEEDYAGFKMQGDGDLEDREIPIATSATLNDQLTTQLGFLGLNERHHIIATQLIGSIENDGYIRRDLEAIINDLAFSQNVETDLDEVEGLLSQIQTFDPPGIAARDLRECLLLQLQRRADHNQLVEISIRIVRDCFEEFTKKHYSKIMKRIGVNDEHLMKEAIDQIVKLNPKPGSSSGGLAKIMYLMPDFLLSNSNGTLELVLNSKNAPELKVSRSYSDMFQAYHKSDKKDKF